MLFFKNKIKEWVCRCVCVSVHKCVCTCMRLCTHSTSVQQCMCGSQRTTFKSQFSVFTFGFLCWTQIIGLPSKAFCLLHFLRSSATDAMINAHLDSLCCLMHRCQCLELFVCFIFHLSLWLFVVVSFCDYFLSCTFVTCTLDHRADVSSLLLSSFLWSTHVPNWIT